MKSGPDPTKSVTLRNRAIAEVNRRFSRVNRAITAAFSLGDYSGLPWPWPEEVLLATNASRKPRNGGKGRITRRRTALGLPTMTFASPLSILGPESTPNRYVYQRNLANISRFDAWLDKLIAAEILQANLPVEQFWLSAYLGTAYTKGVAATRAIISPLAKKQGINLPADSPFNNPYHVDRGRLIYTRSFNNMEGLTSTMKTQMRRVLADGIIRGQNPREIARLLNKTVNGLGKVRARKIARTEIIYAHQEASVSEADMLEAETGFKIDMKWKTAIDGRERDSHRARNGKIYSKEVARTLLGEPNCRCAVFAHIVVK